MRKMKDVFGAGLSTLLVLSMVLGSATPAIAQDNTTKPVVSSYASEFNEAYAKLLDDAKKLDITAYTGTDESYGTETVVSKNDKPEEVAAYWEDAGKVFELYAKTTLGATSVERADVSAEGKSVALGESTANVSDETYTRAYKVTTAEGTTLYNIHVEDKNGNISFWKKSMTAAEDIKEYVKRDGDVATILDETQIGNRVTYETVENGVNVKYVAVSTEPVKTTTEKDNLATFRNSNGYNDSSEKYSENNMNGTKKTSYSIKETKELEESKSITVEELDKGVVKLRPAENIPQLTITDDIHARKDAREYIEKYYNLGYKCQVEITYWSLFHWGYVTEKYNVTGKSFIDTIVGLIVNLANAGHLNKLVITTLEEYVDGAKSATCIQVDHKSDYAVTKTETKDLSGRAYGTNYPNDEEKANNDLTNLAAQYNKDGYSVTYSEIVTDGYYNFNPFDWGWHETKRQAYVEFTYHNEDKSEPETKTGVLKSQEWYVADRYAEEVIATIPAYYTETKCETQPITINFTQENGKAIATVYAIPGTNIKDVQATAKKKVSQLKDVVRNKDVYVSEDFTQSIVYTKTDEWKLPGDNGAKYDLTNVTTDATLVPVYAESTPEIQFGISFYGEIFEDGGSQYDVPDYIHLSDDANKNYKNQTLTAYKGIWNSKTTAEEITVDGKTIKTAVAAEDYEEEAESVNDKIVANVKEGNIPTLEDFVKNPKKNDAKHITDLKEYQECVANGKNFTDEYTIRWYVLKLSGTKWKMDGVLEKKNVTVTFKDETVEPVKEYGSYSLLKGQETLGADRVPSNFQNNNIGDKQAFLGWKIEGDDTTYTSEQIAGKKFSKDTVITASYLMDVMFFLKTDGVEIEEITPTPKGTSYTPMGKYDGKFIRTVKKRVAISGGVGNTGDPSIPGKIDANIEGGAPTAEDLAEYINAMKPVKASGRTAEDYTIRWYVLKYSGSAEWKMEKEYPNGCWHVDGVLVPVNAIVTFQDEDGTPLLVKDGKQADYSVKLGFDETLGDRVFKFEDEKSMKSQTLLGWKKVGDTSEKIYTSDELKNEKFTSDVTFTAVYQRNVVVYLRVDGKEPEENGGTTYSTYQRLTTDELTVKNLENIYGAIGDEKTETAIKANLTGTLPTIEDLATQVEQVKQNPDRYTVRYYVLKYCPEDNYSVKDVNGLWHIDAVLVEKPTATFTNDGKEYAKSYETKGTRVSAPAKNPTKRADRAYKYEFLGWNVAGSETVVDEDVKVIDFSKDDAAVVNESVEYVAVYKRVASNDNVFFYNGEELVYSTHLELTDIMVTPDKVPVNGNLLFEGWIVETDKPDMVAFKSFGELKVSHFAEYFKDGILVFNASFAGHGNNVHHLTFNTNNHGTIILGVEHGKKVNKNEIPTSGDDPTVYETYINRFFGWNEAVVPVVEENASEAHREAALVHFFKAEKDDPEVFDFENTAITRDIVFDPVYKPENKIKVEFFDDNTQVGQTFYVEKNVGKVTTPDYQKTNTETITYLLQGWTMNEEETLLSADEINGMLFDHDTTFHAVISEQEVKGEEFVNPDENGEKKNEKETTPDDGEVLGEEFTNPDLELSTNDEEPAVLGAEYPTTGDTTPIFVIVALLLMSGAALVVFGKRRKEN